MPIEVIPPPTPLMPQSPPLLAPRQHSAERDLTHGDALARTHLSPPPLTVAARAHVRGHGGAVLPLLSSLQLPTLLPPCCCILTSSPCCTSPAARCAVHGGAGDADVAACGDGAAGGAQGPSPPLLHVEREATVALGGGCGRSSVGGVGGASTGGAWASTRRRVRSRGNRTPYMGSRQGGFIIISISGFYSSHFCQIVEVFF